MRTDPLPAPARPIRPVTASRRAMPCAVAALLMIAAAPHPVRAQGTPLLAGLWFCQMGVRDTTQRQRPTVMTQFQVQAMPDGRAFGNGVESSLNGDFQFQLQGQWGMMDGQFVVQGQRNGFFGPEDFFFAARPLDTNSMATTFNAPDGNVIASSCQRQG